MNPGVALIVGLGVMVFVFGVAGLAAYSDIWEPKLYRLFERRQRGIKDKHAHRWSRWEVLQRQPIHLYGEVDEGRALPDRVDVVLERTCVRCGLPQTRTQRGLDSGWRP